MISLATGAVGDQSPDEGIAALISRKERLLGIMFTFFHSCSHQLEVVHDSGECLCIATPFVNCTLVLKRAKAIFNRCVLLKLAISTEGCDSMITNARRFARQFFLV